MADPPRILLVDDEPVLLRLMERMLGSEGYAVTAVSSAEAALAVLEGAKGSEVVVADAMLPDAVVADVRLGSMNGCALGREIVQRWPGTRLLFISGYIAEELFLNKICPKNLPLLPKPFRPDALLRAVETILQSAPWVPETDVVIPVMPPSWPGEV